LSRGAYVQFLDADDLLAPEKIQFQVNAALREPESILCGPWKWWSWDGKTWVSTPSNREMDPNADLMQQWLEGRYYAAHALLWPRTVLDQIGGWDETLASFQDGDLFIRAVLKGYSFHHVAEGLSYYRIAYSGGSISSQRSLASLQSRVKVLEAVEAELTRHGDLAKYRNGLAHSHYALAKGFAGALPSEAKQCYRRFLELSTDRRVPGSLLNHLATRLLGIAKKERLARRLGAFLATRAR